jgi:2-haloacid dehalogenase
MALEGVRALVFDVFGTVVDWRGGLVREAEAFLARHLGSGAQAQAFADAWYRTYPTAIGEVRRGERPFTRLDALLREYLDRILPDFGLDPAKMSAEELDDLSFAWRRLPPWPDSVAGLERLKRGYVIAPVSNANIALMLEMSKRGRLPWDAILGAEIAQAYKTSPECYLRNVETLGLRPEQVCLVAAHNMDLAAARGCGLKTAYVLRPQEFGEAPRPIPPDQDWELVADDFADLAQKLGL